MDRELNFDNCWYKEVCTNTCGSDCIRFLEMSYLMDSSGIPKSKQKPLKLVPSDEDYDAFVELANIKHDIVNFVDNGNNLYLVSNYTGNGKTSWAIKLMLKYFDEIWAGNCLRPRGLFIYTPVFLAKLKDFNNYDKDFEEVKKILTTVDLVIWDDLCSNALTNYDLSQLCNYIDVRVLNDKANIFTGNLLGGELQTTLGSRLYSRVWNTSKHVIFNGKDRRVDKW